MDDITDKSSGYQGNKNAQKSDKPRKGRLSRRVSEADLELWDKQAKSEDVSRTDLIIRVMNKYCQRKLKL